MLLQNRATLTDNQDIKKVRFMFSGESAWNPRTPSWQIAICNLEVPAIKHSYREFQPLLNLKEVEIGCGPSQDRLRLTLVQRNNKSSLSEITIEHTIEFKIPLLPRKDKFDPQLELDALRLQQIFNEALEKMGIPCQEEE